MQFKKYYFFLLLAVSCVKAEIPTTTDSTEQEQFTDNELIVELSDSLLTHIEADSNFFSVYGIKSMERLFPVDEKWENRHREWGLNKWYTLRLDENIPGTKAMDELELIDGILQIERPRKIKSTENFFNDTYYKYAWHYYNDGSLGSTYLEGCDINVLPVWENYTCGSSDVIVAVVDGGVDFTHPDLASVVIPAGPEGSKSFIDNSYNIPAHAHGTHVAGTIGAINNNKIGVCGIAGGSDGKGGVKLLSCEVFRAQANSDKDLSGNMSSAIVWAADHGAVICQNSWGYVYETESDASRGSIGYLKTAIDYFIANAGKDEYGKQTGPMSGGVVIFAAGNDGWKYGWPAAYPEVIAVGAVAADYKRAYYSNYGTWVDICAPGGDANKDHLIISTLPGGKYGYSQGTSMACPHVSGVAALLVSHFGGPGFTNTMLKEKLLGGCSDKYSSTEALGKMLDAMGSFTYGNTTAPDPIAEYSISAKANNIEFSYKVPAIEGGGKAHGALLLASKNKNDFSKITSTTLPVGMHSLKTYVGKAKVGDNLTATLNGLDFNTNYYVSMLAFDYNMNYSEISEIKQISTGINTPPVISTDYTGSFTVPHHESLYVNYTIADPDLHSFNVSFEGPKSAKFEMKSEGKWTLCIKGNSDKPGKYSAKISATDEFGGASELIISYTLLENHAPEILKVPEPIYFSKAGEKTIIDLTELFTDQDNETLTYTATCSSVKTVHTAINNNKLSITALDYGKASITVKAYDQSYEECEQSVNVLVRDVNAEPDIYPQPLVKDNNGDYKLHISGGKESDIQISLISNSGTTIMNSKGTCSAFDPYIINMNSCATGKYKIRIDIDGKHYEKTIVKL